MGQGASTAGQLPLCCPSRTASDDGVTVEVDVQPATLGHLKGAARCGVPLVALGEVDGHSPGRIHLWSLDAKGCARHYIDGKEQVLWRVDEADVEAVPAEEGAGPAASDSTVAVAFSDSGNVIVCSSLEQGKPIPATSASPSVLVAVAWASGRVALLSTNRSIEAEHSDDIKRPQQEGRGFMCSDLLIKDICICTGTRWAAAMVISVPACLPALLPAQHNHASQPVIMPANQFTIFPIVQVRCHLRPVPSPARRLHPAAGPPARHLADHQQQQHRNAGLP